MTVRGDTLPIKTVRNETFHTVYVPWWWKTKWEATIAFLLLIAFMIIGLAIFTFLPIVWALLINFSEARNTLSIWSWIGFENYQAMLSNDQFLRALKTILVFAVFIVSLTFFFSLGLALLVNSVGLGRSFFRTAFFIPTAI